MAFFIVIFLSHVRTDVFIALKIHNIQIIHSFTLLSTFIWIHEWTYEYVLNARARHLLTYNLIIWLTYKLMLLIYAVRSIFVKKTMYCWYCFGLLMIDQMLICHHHAVVALIVVHVAPHCNKVKNKIQTLWLVFFMFFGRFKVGEKNGIKMFILPIHFDFFETLSDRKFLLDG